MPLEGYSVGKVIGKGSYGEVVLARHKKDGRQFVIKKIDLHNASSKERNFAQQEVQILSKMKHPNIVAYKESFQDETGFLYIVMGYCEGGDLYKKLKEQAEKGELLSESQVVEWFVQIAMGLQYMHDRNILHRDLKTQNIFLTKSKIIKLGDLGIARVLESTCDMATTLIGTPYYMSPELFSNKPYNHKSDIWALGCCVYEMTSLKHAFNAKDMNSLVYKILRGKTPAVPKQYSEELCAIIRSMLAYNPAERPSVSKILRQQFIKKHIVMFLEGTKQKKRQKEEPLSKKINPVPVRASKDSGVGDSLENRAAATASAIEIELVPDEKERKEPYIIKEEVKGHQRKISREEKSKGESRVRRRQKEIVPAKVLGAQDGRRQSVEEGAPLTPSAANGHSGSNVVESGKGKGEQRLKQAEEHPLQQDEQRAVRLRAEQRHNARSNRPLPPRPSGMPNEQLHERGGQAVSENPQRIRDVNRMPRQPEMSVGTPNTAARKKRRQRMKEEDIRKSAVSRSSIASIASSRSKDSPDGSDSVDGSGSSPCQGLLSDDDGTGSEVDEGTPRFEKPIRRHRKSSDVGNLIETLQQTLSLGHQHGSERSSPEDSVDSSIANDEVDASPGASGRLQSRISRLKSECLRGLGEDILEKAYRLIEVLEEDQVEDALVELMGRANFEEFGGLVWQLKFCEEFRV